MHYDLDGVRVFLCYIIYISGWGGGRGNSAGANWRLWLFMDAIFKLVAHEESES